MNTMTKQKKDLPFHLWLRAEGLTIQKFAQIIGQGFATVASWSAKSSRGEKIVLKSASSSNIARVSPLCPLVRNK